MKVLEKAALMCESMGADGYGTLSIACAIRGIQTQQSPQSDDVSVKNQVYHLPDDLYDSKDWKAGNYAERVQWLHLMYEDAKQEIERLSETLAQFDHEIHTKTFKE
jgi:hypothetical protein